MHSDQNQLVSSVKTNKKLNANSKKEQMRLLMDFPGESDIFRCKGASRDRACYVKGRLMPTYALGDFHLKHVEFNNPQNLPRSMLANKGISIANRAVHRRVH